MIQVIFGKKGSGKTKRIIDMANESVNEQHGNTIFIDDNNRYVYDIKHQIRFIDASEYSIDSPKMFYGFLCGLAAQDFDLDLVFIDGFLKIVKYDLDKLEELFEHMEQLSAKHGIRFVLSVSGTEGAPEFLKPLIV